jgi:transcriptional regulator with XRE-family HTH domain
MAKDLQRILGKAARDARKALGLTQEQIAEPLGVSTEFYGRIERGAASPSIGMFARMVPILGVSADTLLGADIKRSPGSVPLTRSDESSELHELIAYVRKAEPEVVRLISDLVRDLERVHAARTSTSTRDNSGGKSTSIRGKDTEKTPR